MKKVALIFTTLIFLTAIISADIILLQQPESLYNLGEVVEVSLKVTSLKEINNFLTLNLICNGVETEVHKEYLLLQAGEEQESDAKIPLISSFTNRIAGTCLIKAIIGEEFILSDEFELSNSITISVTDQTTEVKPGKSFFIRGEAKKAKEQNVNGFVDISLIQGSSSGLQITDTVKKGYLNINSTIPENFPAGEYLVSMNVYEKDIEDSITNQGSLSTNLLVSQIPTNLEISLEETEINPNSEMKIKVILHDQTGEKIPSITIIKILNENGKLIEEKELSTDEEYQYPIKYNQAPAEWKIEAVAGELNQENFFTIKSFAKVDVEIINKTILIKNTGNVPYNDTILVQIGEESMPIQINLEVNQEQKYALNAPDGEYEIEILGKTQTVMLTGKAINIRKIGKISILMFSPLVWFFMIGILGFVSYLFFKKGYTKTFIGYITRRRKRKNAKPITEKSLVNSNNKAEISLSIHGARQNTNLICLRIKNLKKNEKIKGDIEETLQQIVNLAEDNKAITYQNQNTIFFLFVPSLTKTFKNEKGTIQTAQIIKKTIDHHNKIFKNKIEYGIALNHGTIIAQKGEDSIKFMSMGTLISEAKKISNEAKEEILISEKFKDKSATNIKTEKVHQGQTPAYKVKQLKEDNQENQKFISNFLKKLEKHK
ncbi:hypothetical protein HN832_04860 [archaeon]|jgi:hypothetical protein|nr:hypothetical protein [archaeon]MBT4374018.1 hypothetical protein [archaeon]MBT4532114.1 hypothetical protein [archaeon]MBT7002004.1 hypothetical protein [archaeon]MBT7282715.1 hypothetical protein [archaeon]